MNTLSHPQVSEHDLRISVQSPMQLGARQMPGYVQVDSMVGGQNQWSSNPAALQQQGYNIPSTQELLQLPQGQYTLAQAKRLLGDLLYARAMFRVPSSEEVAA